MNTRHRLAIASVLPVILGSPFTAAYAQGSLTPPGPPAPTMKTLDEVEARTPISAATNIMESGSYYLTTSILVNAGDGISISADAVTVDLNGFTIRSTSPSPSGSGVRINGSRRNIAIANGFIEGGVTNDGSGTFSGPGFNYGVYSSEGLNVSATKLSVVGCHFYGIYLSPEPGTVSDSCIVRTASSYGIVAGRVKSSVALDCGGTAILANLVTDSRGECVLIGDGISATTVRDSYGYSTSDCGISAETVQNSYGYVSTSVSSAYGISAVNVDNCRGYCYSSAGDVCGIDATTVNNSYGYGSSSADTAYGIAASTVNNCYGYSYCSSSSAGYGIYAESCVQNSYGISAGNSSGHGYGIDAHTASNCRGEGNRDDAASRGIYVERVLENSYGLCSAGHGIDAWSASNCGGDSLAGYGVSAFANAINCVGTSGSADGINTDNAKNCRGSGTRGIYAVAVEGCWGVGTTNEGIYGSSVGNSYGSSDSGPGIHGVSVDNSYGSSDSGYGIDAHSVLNCYGKSVSSRGISATTAQNCYGRSETGTHGLYVVSIAIGCRGYHTGSGIGLHGFILNSCRGSNAAGPSVSYSYKYNMP